MSNNNPTSYQRRRSSHAITESLSIDQVENLWAAFGHSVRLGIRPNETLDFNFDLGGLLNIPNTARECIGTFFKLCRQWIESRGYKTCYFWVLENRGDGNGHGLHAHTLLYVPPALLERFHQLKRRWARKAGLNMNRKGVINRDHLQTLRQAKGKLKYICKDLKHSAFEIFRDASGKIHLDDRNKASNQPVHGKRCGVSRNISRKARLDYMPKSFQSNDHDTTKM